MDFTVVSSILVLLTDSWITIEYSGDDPTCNAKSATLGGFSITDGAITLFDGEPPHKCLEVFPWARHQYIKEFGIDPQTGKGYIEFQSGAKIIGNK